MDTYRALAILLALAALLALGSPPTEPPARGGTAQATLDATAEVVDVCTLVSPPLALGKLDTWEAKFIAIQIMVHCTAGTRFHLSIDNGRHFGTRARHLGNGLGHRLKYFLYFSSTNGTSEEWGDNDFENTYPYGPSYSGQANGDGNGITLIGEFFGDPALPPGDYADAVRLTLRY